MLKMFKIFSTRHFGTDYHFLGCVVGTFREYTFCGGAVDDHFRNVRGIVICILELTQQLMICFVIIFCNKLIANFLYIEPIVSKYFLNLFILFNANIGRQIGLCQFILYLRYVDRTKTMLVLAESLGWSLLLMLAFQAWPNMHYSTKCLAHHRDHQPGVHILDTREMR